MEETVHRKNQVLNGVLSHNNLYLYTNSTRNKCMYVILNYIKVIKPSKMRWVGHTACMTEKRNVSQLLVGTLKVRYHFRDLDIGQRIILKLI
jgi:hypothetical protein